jgi:hypothetical protein
MIDVFRFRFPHLGGSDCTFDSMCARCFAPISRNRNEDDLERMADAHVCRTSLPREFKASDRERS